MQLLQRAHQQRRLMSLRLGPRLSRPHEPRGSQATPIVFPNTTYLRSSIMLESLTLDSLYENGELCPQSGRYRFYSYLDGTTLPPPLESELDIDLLEGDTFPSLLSNGKECLWLLT
jgi:hypothetical protein